MSDAPNYKSKAVSVRKEARQKLMLLRKERNAKRRWAPAVQPTDPAVGPTVSATEATAAFHFRPEAAQEAPVLESIILDAAESRALAEMDGFDDIAQVEHVPPKDTEVPDIPVQGDLQAETTIGDDVFSASPLDHDPQRSADAAMETPVSEKVTIGDHPSSDQQPADLSETIGFATDKLHAILPDNSVATAGPPDSPLAALPGAGPGLIWMLNECNIHTLEDLAAADKVALGIDLGLVGQILNIETWIDFAADHLRHMNGQDELPRQTGT